MDIRSFSGEHRWLSNFWPCKVMLDGVSYPSVEHAYQAAKFPPDARAIFQACTAGKAKALGKKADLPGNWLFDKVDIMRDLIDQKYAPSAELGAKLVDTFPGEIVEGNEWGDTFWGVCRGRGENTLGKLIMARREFLMAMTPRAEPRRFRF